MTTRSCIHYLPHIFLVLSTTLAFHLSLSSTHSSYAPEFHQAQTEETPNERNATQRKAVDAHNARSSRGQKREKRRCSKQARQQCQEQGKIKRPSCIQRE
ncbi:hypothetical protein IQ07DRAFT_284639 [Pyrenochaeta sp. DS3sAY3a]|nr:hypothetical protein IQ07DRAFT_284639 [Pyrenochaeta sp. DS3sAY3a]